MANYFNTLPLREKLNQLGVCEFMDISAFGDGVQALIGKKIVIVFRSTFPRLSFAINGFLAKRI